MSGAAIVGSIVGGGSSIVGGSIVGKKDLIRSMVSTIARVGSIMSPFDAWLVLMSLETLPLRMARHSSNTEKLVEYLSRHPKVKGINYPGPQHPQWELAKKQMRGGSGIVTAIFDLPREQVVKLISNLKLFSLAESLGGIESLICHPASMTHASIPKAEREAVGITDGLVRFSIGIENADDLVEDIQTSLNHL